MKIRSIKAGIGLLAAAILALTVISGITAYCSLLSQRADADYQQVLELEKQLAVVILTEEESLEGTLSSEAVAAQYELLEKHTARLGLMFDEPLLKTRREAFLSE